MGCHGMSVAGVEYRLNDCVKINSAKVFEVALDEMMSQEGPYSTERLWELYQKHMARAVEVTAEGLDFHLKYQQYNEPELMLNLISHGPVEKGLDMTCGGAMYYNLCMDGSAISDRLASAVPPLKNRFSGRGRRACASDAVSQLPVWRRKYHQRSVGGKNFQILLRAGAGCQRKISGL